MKAAKNENQGQGPRKDSKDGGMAFGCPSMVCLALGLDPTLGALPAKDVKDVFKDALPETKSSFTIYLLGD